MDEQQTTTTEELSSVTPRAKLSEGYMNINRLDIIGYGNSTKSLNEYLKDQVVAELSNIEGSWEIIEEREEFKPTDYILNPRHLRTFVAQNTTATNQKIFVFDVEGYA